VNGVPRGPLLVLSPHRDDAVLSCAALLDRDEAADVVTIFTGRPRPPRRTDWDARCGFVDSDEAIAVRADEDRAAFAGTAHRVDSLDLVEHQYLDGPRPTADAPVLAESIRSWAARVESGTVAVPAGAGAPWGGRSVYGRIRRRLSPGSTGLPPHPDHVYVRGVALRVLDGLPRLTPLLYEELPYCFGRPGDGAAASAARAWSWTAALLTLPVDRERKAALIRSYRSQLWSFTPPLHRPDAVPPVERYWQLVRSGAHRGWDRA
jgi:LmbE family N-acetylglucosaminyl deacetylase